MKNKLIKIYGERHTSTNYLEKLLQLNYFVDILPGIEPVNLETDLSHEVEEGLRDGYFDMNFRFTLGWKHMRAVHIPTLDKASVDRRQVNFVVTVKNPYAWLCSMFAMPYHYWGAPRTFREFLNTDWRTVERDNICGRVTSPMVLWNTKNASYVSFKFGGYDLRAITIPAEQLVRHPSHVISQIGMQFGLKRRGEFKNYLEPLTSNRRERTHEYYREFYAKEKWRENLYPRDVETINEAIDWDLAKGFGYYRINPEEFE